MTTNGPTAREFSEEIINIIEETDRYQQWKEQQDEDDDEVEDEVDIGTYLEPFEMYKLLAYDELNGNVSIRDSPLYYFQTLGYESAKTKLSQYDGCIISDSVGLGKSFIGSELLYDYREQGDRCLLIVPANLTDQWAISSKTRQMKTETRSLASRLMENTCRS